MGPGDFIDVCISVQKYNLTEVVYCTKNWRHLEEIDNISIIGAEEAYDKLLKGEMINEPMTWFTFEINEISVGYYSYFNSHPQEYYKPVWIFYGKLDGSDWYFAVEATK